MMTTLPSDSNASRSPWSGSGDVSLSYLLAILLRHRYAIFLSALLLGAGAAGKTLLQDRTYTAEFSFVPESASSRPSGISAIAGQFGIQVPATEASSSPQFYIELLRSRAILTQLIGDTFRIRGQAGEPAQEVQLADVLELKHSDPLRRRNAAISWLRSAISTRIVREAGVVHVSVRAPAPELSHALGTRLIELLNEFNLRTRQTRAASERRFIEERLREVEQELASAESELQTFLSRNRQFQNAPQLSFQLERLERRVMADQQRVIGLRDALYETQLAELRDTPVISVVEQPETPPVPDSRGTRRSGVLGFLFGGIFSYFFFVARDAIRRRTQTGADDARDLTSAWRDAVDDIRRLAFHR